MTARMTTRASDDAWVRCGGARLQRQVPDPDPPGRGRAAPGWIGANLIAFVVAFVAGTAGIVALGRAKSGAVVGVLVSITTIPAASNVGVALAMGSLSEAGRSMAILLVNLAWAVGRRGADPARDPGVGAPDRGGAGDLPTEGEAWVVT